MTLETHPNVAPRLKVLQQLFATATHEASAAMCRWTDGLIALTLDEVREIDIVDLCAELGVDDANLTMVVLHVEGEAGGEMLLVFDESDGRRLAAALLERDQAEDGPWSDLEKSVLTETGNILGCTYLNALSRLIGQELLPTPPYFVQDYGASVLQQAVMAQVQTCDKLLVCRTNFHRDLERLDWQVLFIPTEALYQRLEASCRTIP